MPNNYLPVCLNLNYFKILIVGGGHAAFSKLKTLRRFDCSLRIVTKEVTPALQKLIRKNRIPFVLRAFKKSDLKGCNIVYACTDNTALNRQIAQEARKQRMLCNIAGDFRLSSFISTAIYRKNKVMVAVSTSGASPSLAVSIRNKLKKRL